MNTYIKTLTSITILAVLTLTGCATTEEDSVLNDTMNIEKISSREATVVFVNITQSGDHLVLRGMVRRRLPGRGLIPGHIDLEVIGANGAVLENFEIAYHRHSIKSSYASFRAILKTTPPPGSKILVIHKTDSL